MTRDSDLQTEKARHVLAVQDKINDQKTRGPRDIESSSTHSKPDKDHNNRLLLLAARCTKDQDDEDDVIVGGIRHDDDSAGTEVESERVQSSEQRQRQLMARCLKLLQQKHFLELAAEAGSNQVSSSFEPFAMSSTKKTKFSVIRCRKKLYILVLWIHARAKWTNSRAPDFQGSHLQAYSQAFVKQFLKSRLFNVVTRRALGIGPYIGLFILNWMIGSTLIYARYIGAPKHTDTARTRSFYGRCTSEQRLLVNSRTLGLGWSGNKVLFRVGHALALLYGLAMVWNYYLIIIIIILLSSVPWIPRVKTLF